MIQSIFDTISNAEHIAKTYYDLWYFVILVLGLTTTVIYLLLTYSLWRTTKENHDAALSEQKKILVANQYFEYRRIWNGVTMIVARNDASAIVEAVIAADPDQYVSWIKSNINPYRTSPLGWPSISLIAHFMSDIQIEITAKKFSEKDAIEGFVEFPYWIDNLLPMFYQLRDEAKLIERLKSLRTVYSDPIESFLVYKPGPEERSAAPHGGEALQQMGALE